MEFFDRDILDPDDYPYFWERWWRASRSERAAIRRGLDRKIERQDRTTEERMPERVSTSLALAQREARRRGGYVVRRDRFGRFNPRGRRYQVIVRRK